MCEKLIVNMTKYHPLDDDPILQTIHMDWTLSNEEIKKEYEEELRKKLEEYESYLKAGESEYDKAFLFSAEKTVERIKEILSE